MNHGLRMWRGSRGMAAFALAISIALGAVGCAEDVGDIDRTQANKFEKKKLAGVWYFLQTMIDVPQQTAQGFIGNTNFGNSAKVVFDIQETRLYVVPTVETVQFAEAQYTKKQIRNYWDEGKSHEFVEMWVGQPLAAYPIVSHFDVIRDYNASTGAQSNVIVENTTDRPWHAREFMRVDWGGNAILDWAFPVGSSQFSPVDHYVAETDYHLAAPGTGLDPDTFEATGEYLSFVTKAYIPPGERDWQGYVCNSYSISNKDCAGAVIKVRNSFMHVPPTADYETFVYTNREHMDKFGYFLADRYSYDKLWNLTESARDYKAQRRNLWQRTWKWEDIKDADGATIGAACASDMDCGTDEVVTDYSAKKCFKTDWYRAGTCMNASLIPYRERGLKPIVYHLNANVQPEMVHYMYETADGWSKAFKETVAWLYTLEGAGRYWTKVCKSNDDCVKDRLGPSGDILADVSVELKKVDAVKVDDVAVPNVSTIESIEIPATCPASWDKAKCDACKGGNKCVCQEGWDATRCSECKSGDQCQCADAYNIGGVCSQATFCDASTPCPTSQICSEGSCFAKDAATGAKLGQVIHPVQTKAGSAMTIVLHTDDKGAIAPIRVQDDYNRFGWNDKFSCNPAKGLDADHDCPKGLKCSIRGKCQGTLPTDFKCLADFDCASGFACGVWNQCVYKCSGDADCGSGLACGDSKTCEFKCTKNSECGSGYCDAGKGACGFKCEKTTDCAAGLTCDEIDATKELNLCAKGGVAVRAQKAVDAVAIRFVNATPGADVSLLDGSGAEIAPATKYDPATIVRQAYLTRTDDGTKVPATHKTVALKTSTGAGLDIQLNPGVAYVVAYVGGNTLISAQATLGGSQSGVRFLDGVIDGAPIDVGLTGKRAATNLTLGKSSSYTSTHYDDERLTVLKTGVEGDITCYNTLHEGKCIGWQAEWPTDLQTTYQNTLQSLPDMFVLCQNQYDLSTEQKLLEDAKSGKERHQLMHDGRYSATSKNPYNLEGSQDLAPGTIFNPCKDLVPAPTELKKIGDVRYSYLYWVGENQAASPLGYGPSAGDPETGEVFWATAYVYGAPMITYGQLGKDIVDLVNGDLTTQDVITGDYVRNYMNAKGGDPAPTDNDNDTYYGALSLPDTKASLEQALATSGQFDRERTFHPLTDPLKANPELFRFMTDEAYQKELLSTLPTVPTGHASDRLGKIRGTVIEDLMINDEVRMGLSNGAVAPGQTLTEEERNAFSPASWATTDSVLESRNKMHMLARAPCSYDREFVDDNVYGLAKEFVCTEDEKAQFAAGTLKGKMCLEGDALRWELTGRIFAGVMEHEVGHTIGLRHNFAGSADLFNYHEDWFKVREKQQVYCQNDDQCDNEGLEICDLEKACESDDDCAQNVTCKKASGQSTGQCKDGDPTNPDIGVTTGLCASPFLCTDSSDCPDEAPTCKAGKCLDGKNTPRGEPVKKYVPRTVQTEGERLGKMSELQYSTVMDYGSRINSDIHGLGKYDYAAVKFGYGKMVEVYADTSKMTNRIEKTAKYYNTKPEYVAGVFETSNWRYAGTIFHPFYYLEDYIGVAENLKRRTVPYDKVKLEHQMQSNYNDRELNWTYVEVPYRFCSDEFNGNLGCYTYDTGVDVGEVVANAMNQINDYYIMDAFMRDRLFSGTRGMINGYFSRMLGRWYNQIANAGRYFAIYDNIFKDRSWYPDFVANAYAMKTLRDAAESSFVNLAQILATPAPGSFKYDATDRTYRNVTYDPHADGTDLTVPVGVGKFPYTQWMTSDSYYYQDHVAWVGSFWLKLGALMTLTDSTFYSASDWVGEQLAIGRSSAVGFNTLYQREMTALIGGIVAESLDNYSGVVDLDATGKPVLRARNLFDTSVDADKDTVEPGLNNLTLKLYASVYGLANLPAGFDPSFTDSMAVFLKGSGHEYDVTAGAGGVKKVEFEDPFGAKTYVAYAPNYDAKRFAAAYTIVKEAQDLREQWDQATGAEKATLGDKLKKRVEVLDILRQLHTIYGNLLY